VSEQTRACEPAVVDPVQAGSVQQARGVARPRSRRDLLKSALVLPLLVACARSGASAQPSAGAWSFEDDRGVTASRPSCPQRIVGHVGSAAALWDYGIRVIGTFGPRRRDDGVKNPLLGDVEIDALQSVGDVWGDFDVEKLAALRPDLIVSTTYDPSTLWYVPANVAERVGQVAPTVGINVVGPPVTEPISRFEALASSLGADLSAPPVVDARRRFERASEALKAAIGEKPGLRALAIGTKRESLHVAKPADYPDLLYFQQLGLEIVAPTNPEPFWQQLSWEQATRYPADLILHDVRPQSLTSAQLAEIPTWNEHPAVKAGQVGAWRVEAAYSHKGFATVLEDLTETVRRCRADVV
jgi:iron complex transport system substrate-binding protein